VKNTKKLVGYIVGAIGLISAIIGIWVFMNERMDNIEADIKITMRNPVFWESEPIEASINVTDGKKNIDKYKIVILQRNIKESGEEEHFQFEKLLTSVNDNLKGNIWFGSADKGNNESYIVTAIIVKREFMFKQHPSVYSLNSIPYKAKAISQLTVSRDDTVGKANQN
jgi:hypothetical protein